MTRCWTAPLAALIIVLMCAQVEMGAGMRRTSRHPSSATATAATQTRRPSPACIVNGTPCPPPRWPPNYNLTLATVCQPGGTGNTGYFLPPADSPWGLVSLDWSVGVSLWQRPDPAQSICETVLTDNCRLIKAQSPGTRCFVYHNLELALEWLESQRAVMYNASLAPWFLQYTDGHGHKNGTVYNERIGFGDQFFWDFREPAAADYYIASVLRVTADAAIDGSFTDDVVGFPEEHDGAVAAMNLSAADVADIEYATQATFQRLLDALVAAGKYNWQALVASNQDDPQDSVAMYPTNQTCTAWMLSNGAYFAKHPNAPLAMGFDADNPVQVLASFLLVRPHVAYLGWGWESDQHEWNSLFLLDVGKPLAPMENPSPNIFTRMWTYGQVHLNCTSWTATVPHAAGRAG